jgi:hypothetical protein
MRSILTARGPTLLGSAILAANSIIMATAGDAGSNGASSRQERFRILYPPAAATPYETGDHGKRNQAALAEMGRILGLWSEQPSARFLFVAPRPAGCTAHSGCNPEQLMWQRVNTAVARIKEISAAQGRRVRFTVIRLAFLDELDVAMRLPLPPADSEAVDLFSDPDRATVDDAQCGGRILIFDPDLPPAVGAVEGRPVMRVSPGTSLVVGRDAVVSVAVTGQSAGSTLAVWENARGEFRIVAPAAFSAAGTRLPQPSVGLHVVRLGPQDAELERFRVALSEDFKHIASVPAVLQGHRAKGLGDDVRMLPPGSVGPAQPEGPRVAHCLVGFDSTASLSSR